MRDGISSWPLMEDRVAVLGDALGGDRVDAPTITPRSQISSQGTQPDSRHRPDRG